MVEGGERTLGVDGQAANCIIMLAEPGGVNGMSDGLNFLGYPEYWFVDHSSSMPSRVHELASGIRMGLTALREVEVVPPPKHGTVEHDVWPQGGQEHGGNEPKGDLAARMTKIAEGRAGGPQRCLYVVRDES